MWNLSHLKYFSDAARTSSITASAKINHISVSAVSQAVRALESQLDVSLLEHRKKEFQLTPAGRLLLAESLEVLNRMDQLKNKIGSTKKSQAGPLRIACSNAVAQALLPQLLKKLLQKSPHIKPQIFIANARKTRELLMNRDIDLALAVHESPLNIFSSSEVLSGKFVFVTHALNEKKKVFSQQSFITGDTGEEIDHFHLQFRKRFSQDPQVSMETQSWLASLALTRKGLGISLIPDFMFKIYPDIKILNAPVQLLKYKMNLYYRQENENSPLTQIFSTLWE